MPYGYFCALLLLAVPAVPPAAAQVTTNTALPVARGQAVMRVQAVWRQASGAVAPAERDVRVLAFPLVGAYGVSARLAAFAVLPLLDKRLEVRHPGERRTRRTTGPGDARLFARYTAWQYNRRGLTVRLAPFAGLELPTGAHTAADALGRLPAALQRGSGSWDPFAGVVLTRQSLGWQLDVSAAYQANTTVGGVSFGDEARLDVSAKVRVLPRRLGGGLPHFLYAGLESNLAHRGRDTREATPVADTGGSTWFLAPSLQYVTWRWMLEAAVQLPVVADLNGAAPEPDFVVILGLRLSI